MRLLIQRILRGAVTVEGKLVGKVNKGIHILLGVTHGDTEADIEHMINRVLALNLWEKGNSTMNQKTWDTNLVQNGYDIMVVSQFTLYGYLKGNKPDFHKALEHEQAKDLYIKFVEVLQAKYAKDKVQTGAFGEYMNVELENDGPVTLIIESAPKSAVEPAEVKKSVEDTKD
eukprot:TRINITY_DN3398_c0_g1_i10.p2 TRINITY_DN3398_c0_g1~~TRINITY_DN3398_c0_g1_i10.p2  ORF type:complete len:172 (+),score=34.53 TRINITY_DN3398_c0_g1_i10:890-1405(+)